MTTHLADVQSILDTIDASIATNDFGTYPNKNAIPGAKWAFIDSIEIYNIESTLERFTFLYEIELRGLTDTIIEAMTQALLTNVFKIKSYTAIVGYTKPTNMVSINLYSVGSIKKNYGVKTGTWSAHVKLLIKWSA